MSEKLSALIRSRRFWVAIAGVVVVVTDAFALPVSGDGVMAVTLLLASWIVGDSIKSTV